MNKPDYPALVEQVKEAWETGRGLYTAMNALLIAHEQGKNKEPKKTRGLYCLDVMDYNRPLRGSLPDVV